MAALVSALAVPALGQTSAPAGGSAPSGGGAPAAAPAGPGAPGAAPSLTAPAPGTAGNAPNEPVIPSASPLFRPSDQPLGPWQITPGVEVRQTFTDNVRSRNVGQEREDTYTTLIPSVKVTRASPSNRFALNYRMQARHYWDNDNLDDLTHNLSQYGNTELINDFLFLDTRGLITRTTIDEAGTVSAQDDPRDSNTSSVFSFSVSPYIRNRFGNIAQTEVRYLFNETDYGAGQLVDTRTNRFSAAAVSGPEFTRLLWNVNLDYSTTERLGTVPSNTFIPQLRGRDFSDPVVRKTAEAGGEYVITPQWSALLGGGWEEIKDPTLINDISGPFWSLGARWRPGPRTDLRLSFGNRYDENFWAGSGSYELSPDTKVSVRYSEGIQTASGEIRDNLGALEVDEFGNFIDSRTLRQFNLRDNLFGLATFAYYTRRGDAVFSSRRGRDTFEVVGLYEEREGRAINRTQEIWGLSGYWRHELTPLTSGSLTLRYRNTTFEPITREDDTYGASLGVIHELAPQTQAFGSYSYVRRDSSLSSADMRENVLVLGVRRFF